MLSYKIRMPYTAKKESSPFGYAFVMSFGGLFRKATKLALILTATMELGIRSADLTAKISGYNDQYENNAPKITRKLEDELNIDIHTPRIYSSFAECRAAFIASYLDYANVTEKNYGPLSYIPMYYHSTREALLMNRHIAELLYGPEHGITVALYSNKAITFAPFDNSPKFEEDEKLVLAHEIMHGYVHEVNPHILDVDDSSEFFIRLTIDEGIATYASEFVYGNGFLVAMSEVIQPTITETQLDIDKLSQYFAGTGFVSKVVNEIGPQAITLIAQHPPKTFEELSHPEDYAHWLQTIQP